MPDRTIIVQEHFGFLHDTFGFRVIQALTDEAAMGNATVMYESTSLGIEVTVDRGQALIALGDPSDSRWDWFDLTDVLQVYAPELRFAYILPEKQDPESEEGSLDSQLAMLADHLRKYCEGLLQGEPLNKIEIRRQESKRVRAQFGGHISDAGASGH